MQSKREYLVSKGLAKPGRGKFSNAAKEAIAKAEADGMKFSDGTGATGILTKNSAGGQSDQKTETPVVKADPRDSLYVSPADFRFPEAEYVAVARDNNGKRVLHSMRECCNTCRVSLTNHMCNTPTIHNDVTVKIERR